MSWEGKVEQSIRERVGDHNNNNNNRSSVETAIPARPLTYSISIGAARGSEGAQRAYTERKTWMFICHGHPFYWEVLEQGVIDNMVKFYHFCKTG